MKHVWRCSRTTPLSSHPTSSPLLCGSLKCYICNTSKVTDIGIPNGPAEDSTLGLLKAHDRKNMKIRKPKLILRKVRIVIEVVFVILRDEL
jgi:hypothetical protein